MNVTVDINAVLLGGGRESGVERCIRGLIEALHAHGSLSYRVWVRPSADLGLPETDRFKVVKTHFACRSRALRILWEQVMLPLHLRRGRAGVLHAPGYVAPLIAPRPVILTVYDLVALRFPQWAATANAWHYRCLLPASVRRAAVVVTPSNTVRDDIRERFGLPAESVNVIAPAVNPLFANEPTETEIEAVTRRFQLPSDYLLYVGNIEPKKNTGGLLEAYARLRRRQAGVPPLLIVGALAWKSGDIAGRMRELDLEQAVVFTGPVSDVELRVIYRRAVLLVMPSFYEGFGLPPLEAMACGTPVVSSSGGALPETVGEAALVVEPDVPGLEQGLACMLSDGPLRERLRARGRVHAARHRPADVALQHDALYCRIGK